LLLTCIYDAGADVPQNSRKHRLAAMKDCTILYVEDDDATAFLFQTALRETGITLNLFRVVDGNAALDFLTRSGAYGAAPRPDLVVVDLNLPGKSGLDIIIEIRRNESLAALTAVVFSSSSNPEDREQSLKVGADAYFTKEPDLNAFIDAVEKICRSIPVGPVLRTA
jgi:CheY-like chemotaxis protein